MVPVIEGRETLSGGPIEVRFVGESIDFRDVAGAVLVPRVDLLERVDEPDSLVGDLFGDLNWSAQVHKAIEISEKHLPPTLIQVQTSLEAWGSQHSHSVSSRPLGPARSASSPLQQPCWAASLLSPPHWPCRLAVQSVSG